MKNLFEAEGYGGESRRVWVFCVHSRNANVDIRFRREVNIPPIREQPDESEVPTHALSGNVQHTLSVITSVVY